MEHGVNAFAGVRGAGRPAFLYTQAILGENGIQGRLFLRRTGRKKDVCLSPDAGDFDRLSAVEYNGAIYAAVGEYENGRRTLWICAVEEDKLRYRIAAADGGKWDHPFLCVHEGSLYLACDVRRGDYVDVCVFRLDPDTGEILRTLRPTARERASCPVLASCGSVLYLAYESFFAGRYHMMVRVLEPHGRSFSQAVEAGCNMVNDNAPSLCGDGEACYLCWENSSPLFEDYGRTPSGEQSGPKIPSYGHGWRVNSRLMLRRLSLREGVLSVELPAFCADREASVFDGTTQDAGEASVFVHEGRLFLVFVENAGHWHYRAAAACAQGDRFVRLQTPEVLLYDRRSPAYAVDGGELILYGETDSWERVEYRAALPEKECKMPDFRPDRTVKLNTLRGTPGYCVPVRETVDVDGETFSLFWGDVHMHSNISHCSRHPSFHCTNVEEKHRFSRDAGGLDFCLLTDHDPMSDLEWERTVKAADFSNEDGCFTAFSSYEWTNSRVEDFHSYGHYSVIYRSSGKLHRVRDDGFHDLSGLWRELSPGGAMLNPFHPGEGGSPLDWNYFNGTMSRLVEIYQVRGSYEYDGCEFDPRKYGRKITENHSVQFGLNKGCRFGFTGGGEHEGVGLTGVFARSLTRDGIFEAMRQRRTYATTSVHLYAVFFADGCWMGGEIPEPPESVALRGAVRGSDDIVSVKAVTNLGEIDLMPGYQAGSGTFEADCKTEGVRWIYIRIRQADGNMAWLSPVFLGTDEYKGGAV